jgi:hypothetical protein
MGDHDRRSGRNLMPRLAVLLSWRQAAEWLHEQDRRRAAEQRRFARERVRLELEALWDLPASTPSPPARPAA